MNRREFWQSMGAGALVVAAPLTPLNAAKFAQSLQDAGGGMRQLRGAA